MPPPLGPAPGPQASGLDPFKRKEPRPDSRGAGSTDPITRPGGLENPRASSTIRGGNRAGRTGLGRANSGPGQNRAGPKLARFFRANILTAQPVLKTGPVGPNSRFKVKKNSSGSGRAGSYRAGPYRTGPNLARFFSGQ